MTGRRLLPKIGMRYKVLYILAFLLCANSLFLQIESPIITIGDKMVCFHYPFITISNSKQYF